MVERKLKLEGSIEGAVEVYIEMLWGLNSKDTVRALFGPAGGSTLYVRACLNDEQMYTQSERDFNEQFPDNDFEVFLARTLYIVDHFDEVEAAAEVAIQQGQIAEIPWEVAVKMGFSREAAQSIAKHEGVVIFDETQE